METPKQVRELQPLSTIETNLEQLEPSEREAVTRYQEKLKARKAEGKQAVRYDLDKEKKSLTYRATSQIAYEAQLTESFGVSDLAAAAHLQTQLVGTLPAIRNSLDINGPLALVDGISPQNALEGILATQMVSVHNTAMEFAGRAMKEGQTSEGTDRNINRATKLMGLFTRQVEALHKLRTGGKQVIQVQHQQVNVGQGGQAVIGDVHNQGRG